MSEDLENKGVKSGSTRKKVSTKTNNSKVQKTKEETKSVNAEYKYEPKEDETLIMDKPSTPLVKEEKKNDISMQKPSAPIKTNGQIYEAYINELKNFKLVYNGDVIYDSTLSKNRTNLKFEADYFVLFGKKYSYNGLRIQKI